MERNDSNIDIGNTDDDDDEEEEEEEEDSNIDIGNTDDDDEEEEEDEEDMMMVMVMMITIMRRRRRRRRRRREEDRDDDKDDAKGVDKECCNTKWQQKPQKGLFNGDIHHDIFRLHCCVTMIESVILSISQILYQLPKHSLKDGYKLKIEPG